VILGEDRRDSSSASAFDKTTPRTIDHHFATTVRLPARATKHRVEYWEQVLRLSPCAMPDLRRRTSGSAASRVHQRGIPAYSTKAPADPFGPISAILVDQAHAAQVVRRTEACSCGAPVVHQHVCVTRDQFVCRNPGTTRSRAKLEAGAKTSTKYCMHAFSVRVPVVRAHAQSARVVGYSM
jgi:hypothetical protein